MIMTDSASWYARKRVLVTGGAGFIGSHIVDELIQHNATVTVLDNFSTGSFKNIEQHIQKITLIEGDITSSADVALACNNQEVIFHCAARTSVPESQENPLIYYHTNVLGTAHILQAAAAHARIIFSSSAAVYGNQSMPCKENMLCAPTSVYGLTKLMGEQMCKMSFLNKGVASICLRYFNVFGPRQTYKKNAGVHAQMIRCLMNNEPLTLYGDGMQERDFVPVSSIAKANVLLATLPLEFLKGQPVNIATGKSITLIELYKKLQREFPLYTGQLIFLPERQGDIKSSRADITLLESYVLLAQQVFKNDYTSSQLWGTLNS